MASARMPLFSLPDTRGDRRGTEELWQRRDMLVAMLHPSCAVCRSVRAALETTSRERDVDVGIVVLPAERAAAGVLQDEPSSWLIDSGAAVAHEIREALGVSPGSACVAAVDRYGDVYAVLPAHDTSSDHVASEALDWIEHIEEQCPE